MCGIIAITSSNGKSVSPWKMPLWIFTSGELFPPAVNSTFQLFIASVMNFMTLLDILNIFRLFCYTGLLDYITGLFVIIPYNGLIFLPCFALSEMCWSMSSKSAVLGPCGVLFVLWETVSIQASSRSPP